MDFVLFLRAMLVLGRVGGDGFILLFSSLPGEVIQSDYVYNIFQMGWNHQLDMIGIGGRQVVDLFQQNTWKVQQ